MAPSEQAYKSSASATVLYLFFLSTMDSVYQHGSSSGSIHDGPDFLIVQQHLKVVADLRGEMETR